MAEARFPPTARRLAEARRRGYVAVSPLLVRGAGVAGATAVLAWAGERLAVEVLGLARRAFAAAASPPVIAAVHSGAASGSGAGAGSGVGAAGTSGVAVQASTVVPPALAHDAWAVLAAVLLPVAAAALGAAWIAGVGQTRGVLVLGAPALRERESAWRGLVVATALAIAAVLALVPERAAFAALGGADGAATLAGGLRLASRVALRLAVAMVVVGAADAVLRYLAWRRSLWMTRAEAERERREDEGDPRLRAERRRRHRQLTVAGARSDAEGLGGAMLLVTAAARAVGLALDGESARVTVVGSELGASRLVERARREGIPVRADAVLVEALVSLGAGAVVPAALVERALAALRAARRASSPS